MTRNRNIYITLVQEESTEATTIWTHNYGFERVIIRWYIMAYIFKIRFGI